MSGQRDFLNYYFDKNCQKKGNHEVANLAQMVVDTHPLSD